MTEELKEQYDNLSSSQKKVADYIIDNDEEVAFMTASRLAAAAGVSESTVVRFVSALGYDGFTEFQQAMAEEMQDRLISPKKSQYKKLKADPSELMRKVLVRDAQNIVDSIHLVPDATYDMALDLLQNAKHVYVVGIRSCAPLAEYMVYYLSLMRPDVKALTSSNISELFEQLSWLQKEDVVVGMSFPRYSLRTLKAMEYANNQGARLISITDNEYSPMNLYSSCNLWARTDMITMVDSIVAPMSVVNALVVGLYMRNQEVVDRNLERMEKLWDDFQTYDPDEMAGPEE